MYGDFPLMYLGFGPFEGSRIVIVVLDEGVDGVAQLCHAGEVCPLEGLAAQDTKPDLNLVEPRSVGWSEMKMHIGVSLQPAILLWLMGRKVV